MPTLNAIRNGFARATDLIAPRLCSSCDGPLGHLGDRLCGVCWSELALNVGGLACKTCGEESGPHLLADGRCNACRESRSGHIKFHQFIRAGRYDGVLRSLILRFKHRYVLDDLLGGLLANVLASSDGVREVRHWVPVPSHWRRRLKRGYQPTRLLAQRALKAIGQKPADLLHAVKHVDPFHGVAHMSKARRIEAVKGAFRVSPHLDLTGETVGLIDDVCTTGATLAECARTIKRAGATQIVVAVLAKTSELEALPTGVDPDRA